MDGEQKKTQKQTIKVNGKITKIVHCSKGSGGNTQKPGHENNRTDPLKSWGQEAEKTWRTKGRPPHGMRERVGKGSDVGLEGTFGKR